MAALVAALRMVGMFLPFLARLIPVRFKPAGPIEPLPLKRNPNERTP